MSTTTTPEKITPTIAEYRPVAAGIAKLRAKFTDVVYEKTPSGLAIAKRDRAEIREPRYLVEKIRQEIKAPHIARGKAIDSEARDITTALLEIETPIHEWIVAEENRKEAEKLARETAEREVIEAAERAKLAAERAEQELAAKAERDRISAVEAEQAGERVRQAAERAKLDADIRALDAARLASEASAKAAADRIAADRRALELEQRRARAADIRREAAKITDPIAPEPAQKVGPDAAEIAKAVAIEAEARSLETQRSVIEIPVALSTEAQVRACAEAERALNLARQSPWAEVAAIAHALGDINRTASDRLHELAVLHGGNTEQLEASLFAAGQALKEAECAAAARLIERDAAIKERDRLRDAINAATLKAAQIREAARQAAEEATGRAYDTWSEASGEYLSACRDVARRRAEIEDAAKRVESGEEIR